MSTKAFSALNLPALAFSWLSPVLTLLGALRYPALGLTSLLAAWWFGGYLVANDPDMWAFANFAPGPPSAPCMAWWPADRSGRPSCPACTGFSTDCSGALSSEYLWAC